MRGKQTVRDMVLSLAVIGLFAGLVYLFLPHDATERPPKTVDYRVELLSARRAAPYAVAAPEGLAKDWRATSVRYDGQKFATWHLGFHNSHATYIAVEQSTERPGAFVDRASRGAKETSVTQRIAGKEWRRYDGDDFDALVLKAKGSTTVVTGKASFAQLKTMAAALRTS